jgi:hypothetical protein
MKRIFSILLSIVILASGMEVSVDRHYCCGTLADVKISFTGKAATCGMEQALPGDPGSPTLSKRCCENQISFYSLSCISYPVFNKITHQTAGNESASFQNWNVISIDSYNTCLTSWVMPPGTNIHKSLTRSQICVFRV